MKHGKLPALLILVMAGILALPAISSAKATPETAESVANQPAQSRYMFIDEVKPGMKGYGLTVFSGTKIERFDVEIISVVYDMAPQSDLIIARVSGGPMAVSGVIAGMSGSPIYIDGRMIGALAYSWPFSKEAIAGITPIGEMLDILKYNQKDESQKTITRTPNSEKGWADAAKFSVPLPSKATEYAVMKPIMTPMVFSGFSQAALEFFRPQLQSYGIIPMVGGGGGSFAEHLSDMDVPFEEGSAIGVQLIRGDLSASAIGTVTLKDGDKILAFGHPFMLSGPVDFPMTTAYVHTVLPSLSVSSKMSTALKSVGTLVQDRSAGVSGILGGDASMVPVTLRVHVQGEPTEEYHFEVAKNRQLLPPLIGTALGGSFTRTYSNYGKFAAAVHYDIDIDGHSPVSNDDFISGLGGLPSLASLGLFRDLTSLTNNQFEELSIKSVNIDVNIKEAVETAQITGVRIWKNTLEPGETVDLKIIMQPYMKENVEQALAFKVPESFPEGKAFLQISAASQTAAFERMRSPNKFQPTNIDQLIDMVNESYPGNRIDVRLLVTDPGVVINGEEMAALPSSIFSVISQSMGKEPIGITRSSVLTEQHVTVGYETSGFVTVPITISRKAS
jgi:hypothetical protein